MKMNDLTKIIQEEHIATLREVNRLPYSEDINNLWGIIQNAVNNHIQNAEPEVRPEAVVKTFELMADEMRRIHLRIAGQI